MFALKLSCKLFSACIGVIGLCCSSFLWELILYFTWKNIKNAFDGILEVIVGSLVGVDGFQVFCSKLLESDFVRLGLFVEVCVIENIILKIK